MMNAPNVANQNYENYDYLTTLETGNMTANSSPFNALSVIPALTSLLGVGAALADQENRNEAIKTNLENQEKTLKHTQNNIEKQLVQIDRVVGDKLSASGLESMKRESRLKAASAETGATGTSNAEAVATASVDELHQNAAIIRTGDVQRESKMNEMVSARLNFESATDAIISGSQSAMSAGLETFNAGMKGVNLGLLYLGQSGREDFFGTNTTGVQL